MFIFQRTCHLNRHNLIWLEFEDKAEETAAGHTVLVRSLIGWQLWKQIIQAALFSAAVLNTVGYVALGSISDSLFSPGFCKNDFKMLQTLREMS